MARFLAIHHIEPQAPDGSWREKLTRLAEESLDVGLHPVETVYSRARGVAYTFYEAPDAESIRRLHMKAFATPPDDVMEADRVYPELLAEPRRDRYA